MSRTYTHGLKARERYFGGYFYPMDIGERATPKRKRSQHYCEWMNTPGWWVTEMMNRPNRRRDNRAVDQALRTGDLDVVLMHPKKPHVYYW